jgi:type II pantothenate kinase
VLAANSEPALNDVTAYELEPLLAQAAAIDSVLRQHLTDGRIRVVESGCTSPLIDLGALTTACCAEATDCDLLVLEGMGRAIESNFDATFTIDTIKVALIKDPMVARVIGVELFEPVFRFEVSVLH